LSVEPLSDDGAGAPVDVGASVRPGAALSAMTVIAWARRAVDQMKADLATTGRGQSRALCARPAHADRKDRDVRDGFSGCASCAPGYRERTSLCSRNASETPAETASSDYFRAARQTRSTPTRWCRRSSESHSRRTLDDLLPSPTHSLCLTPRSLVDARVVSQHASQASGCERERWLETCDAATGDIFEARRGWACQARVRLPSLVGADRAAPPARPSTKWI